MDIIGAKASTFWKGKSIPPMAGGSLAPSFQKDVAIDRNLIWWMHDGHRALRVDNWKLVADEGEVWELYDLNNDRAESVDLSKSRPEKVKALERAWDRQLQRMIDTVSESD